MYRVSSKPIPVAAPSALNKMVDYRKWDRLDFDASDSDSDNAEGTRGKVRHGQQLSHTPGRTGAHDGAAGDGRIFEHAEVLR